MVTDVWANAPVHFFGDPYILAAMVIQILNARAMPRPCSLPDNSLDRGFLGRHLEKLRNGCQPAGVDAEVLPRRAVQINMDLTGERGEVVFQQFGDEHRFIEALPARLRLPKERNPDIRLYQPRIEPLHQFGVIGGIFSPARKVGNVFDYRVLFRLPKPLRPNGEDRSKVPLEPRALDVEDKDFWFGAWDIWHN